MACAATERPGDAAVGAELAENRLLRRRSLVDAEFEQKENQLKAQEIEAEGAVEEILNQYQDCRDIADTHDRIVRVDFLARLSVYSRGASKRRRIERRYLNDGALTTEPKQSNDNLFAAYLKGECPDGQ